MHLFIELQALAFEILDFQFSIVLSFPNKTKNKEKRRSLLSPFSLLKKIHQNLELELNAVITE